MSQLQPNRVSSRDTPDPRWNRLYKVGGVAAWIAVLLFRRWLAAEFLLFRGIGIIRFGPRTMPSSVIDWFTLFHTNRLVGLTFFNVFDMVNYLLVGLIFLALYAALRQVNRSYMTLATALALLGIAVYLASNQAFSMLTLSHQYAVATTDAQRSMLLAAGQALLAIHDPNALWPGRSGLLSRDRGRSDHFSCHVTERCFRQNNGLYRNSGKCIRFGLSHWGSDRSEDGCHSDGRDGPLRLRMFPGDLVHRDCPKALSNWLGHRNRREGFLLRGRQRTSRSPLTKQRGRAGIGCGGSIRNSRATPGGEPFPR